MSSIVVVLRSELTARYSRSNIGGSKAPTNSNEIWKKWKSLLKTQACHAKPALRNYWIPGRKLLPI